MIRPRKYTRANQFAAGNKAAAKDYGPRSPCTYRLPTVTQQLIRAMVARGASDSQADAIADCVAERAAALGISVDL